MNTINQPVLSQRDYGYSDELYHHGILGQKWGVRRFQNKDRTWTEAGKIRYGDKKDVRSKKDQKVRKQFERAVKLAGTKSLLGGDRRNSQIKKNIEDYYSNEKKIYEKDKKAPLKDNFKGIKQRHDAFLTKLAKTSLNEMGYRSDDDSIKWMKSQPWFNWIGKDSYVSAQKKT